MKRRVFILLPMILASLATLAQSPDHKGSALQVHVSYSGSGAVDQSHKIYVTLWDSPDFTKDGVNGMKPFATAPITSKSGTAKFQDVQKNPVYVGMAYDPTGKWQADEEPPIGTSLAVYGAKPGTPDPVQLEPGKTTKVSAKLDDSFKKNKMSDQK